MRVFFLSLLICVAGVPLFAQNNARPATDPAKAFMQKIEQRVSKVLTDAAKSMPGNWSIHFNADKTNETSLFSCSLSMEYIATKQEQAAMDKELAQHYKSMNKQDIIAGDRTNDPTLRYSIEVTAIINPYSFTPVDIQQTSWLGGIATVPGTVLTLFRAKKLGPVVPYYSLYLGNYQLTNKNGKQFLEENFVATRDCCNAKTMLIEVHSSQAMANSFISKLDMPALNRILQEF